MKAGKVDVEVEIKISDANGGSYRSKSTLLISFMKTQARVEITPSTKDMGIEDRVQGSKSQDDHSPRTIPQRGKHRGSEEKRERPLIDFTTVNPCVSTTSITQHAIEENTTLTQSSGTTKRIGANSPLLAPSYLSLCRPVIS